MRKWKGQTHRVMVQDEGFAYEGKTNDSLSVIARAAARSCRAFTFNWHLSSMLQGSAGQIAVRARLGSTGPRGFLILKEQFLLPLSSIASSSPIIPGS